MYLLVNFESVSKKQNVTKEVSVKFDYCYNGATKFSASR